MSLNYQMPLMRIFFHNEQTKGKIGKTRDLIVWHFEGLRSFREEAAFNRLGLGICKAFKTRHVYLSVYRSRFGQSKFSIGYTTETISYSFIIYH